MKSLWKNREAVGKDKLDLLVYRSQLIGRESALCVWGGGNTSTKWEETDFRGRRHRILRVKGSGSDLKSCKRNDFSPLLLGEILPVFHRQAMTDEEMVQHLRQCLLDPAASRPSIEALLHAFVSENDIDHTHADAILSLTNTVHAKQLVQQVFGKEFLWVPYMKPGFTLAKWVGSAYRRNPHTKGAILEKHGLMTWGEDAKVSYERTIEAVSRAEDFIQSRKRQRPGRQTAWTLSRKEREAFLNEHLPHLRRVLSTHRPVLLWWNDSPTVLAYLNSPFSRKASQQGPATPDHMLRTKRIPHFVEVGKGGPLPLPPGELERQLKRYAADHQRYYLCYRKPGQPMLDPFPRVVLIPGVGMITTGKDLQEAQIVSEIYVHSISVQMNASSIDTYQSLPPGKAFEIEYWPLELYKLTLAPKESELSRQVGLLTGAAGGIGRAIARKLIEEGTHLILTDLDKKKVTQLSQELNEKMNSPRTIGFSMDVTKESEVVSVFERSIRFFGGLDFLVSNAGVAHVGAIDRLSLESWNQSFAVNATGHFLVARAAVRYLRAQRLGGSLVFITSKNVLAPGREFGAYSAAKSAEAQLARILAMENGDVGIRVNMVNPDGVFEGSGLWRTIKKDRARAYGISEDSLAAYYRNRNLMKVKVVPEDVAEAVSFFISGHSSKTTGCILTVDGGLREAFPR